MEATSSDAAPTGQERAEKDPSWREFLSKSLQDSIKKSPYGWCIRESGLWGIGTGTGMLLHRLRMGTSAKVAGHFFFGTTLLVMLPSYYFCFRRLEHKEKVIQAMMEYNQFSRMEEMPPETPLEEHPFWQKVDPNDPNDPNNKAFQHEREFLGMIKERKEWQKQQKSQDLNEVFREKK